MRTPGQSNTLLYILNQADLQSPKGRLLLHATRNGCDCKSAFTGCNVGWTQHCIEQTFLGDKNLYIKSDHSVKIPCLYWNKGNI